MKKVIQLSIFITITNQLPSTRNTCKYLMQQW